MDSRINQIAGGRVLLPNGEIKQLAISIESGKIAGIDQASCTGESFDAGGCLVIPGLIDIHTHGLGFECCTSGDITAIAALEAAQGTTCVIPTLFGPPKETISNLMRHRKTTNELTDTPQLAGFRLESPYLANTGAGISDDLAPIDASLTDEILEAGGGHIKIWDISPELAGAPEAISYLSNKGIVCSIAHTLATIEQARAAVDAGAKLVTHLFDTFYQPEMTDPGVYPAGLVDYLLVEDRVSCEIIPDGVHVHPLLVEKAIRCKGADGIVFVTDSNFGAGLDPGDYDLPGGWGRARVTDANNGVRMIDREMGLAGSALTPIHSFRNAIRLFVKDIALASKLCSDNPARLLGLSKGQIAIGYDADFTILTEDLELMATICAGRVVYKSS